MSNMVVRTNINSLNAHRNIKNTGAQQRQASNRLSSGFRINSAADDAAGLAISETMRAQIRGLDQGFRNTNDGIALIQTAEGGIAEINAMIKRMRELVVQAANDTNAMMNRKQIQLEIDQLAKEIDKMAHRVEFNGRRLLSGNYAGRPSSAFASAMATAEEIVSGFNQAVNSTSVIQVPVSISETPPAVFTDVDVSVTTDPRWSFSGGVLTIHNVAHHEALRIDGTNPSFAAVNRIVIENGTDLSGLSSGLIFRDVNIAVVNDTALYIEDNSLIDIWLEGSNILSNNNSTHAIISNAIGSHLTINGSGNLSVNGTNSPPAEAIVSHGNIVINGGNITALGHNGIMVQAHGSLTINGGNISAISNFIGAGIYSGGSLTINGGQVFATGGDAIPFSGVGIQVDFGNNMVINGGIVRARGGQHPFPFYMAININSGAVHSQLILVGGLLEIDDGHRIWGSREDLSDQYHFVRVLGGNLSINQPNDNLQVLNGIRDGLGHEAWQTQIFLNDTSFNFPPHTPVTYTIDGVTINAITDSQGRLFMYFPLGTPQGTARMLFDNNEYLEIKFLLTAGHDGNHLVLGRLDLNGPEPGQAGPLWIQIGANSTQGMFVWIERMDTIALGLREPSGSPVIDVVNPSGQDISELIDTLDDALIITNNERTNLGAYQNRLEFAARSVAISSENLSDAESRVRNADMAREMMDFTQMNILFQAGMMMLAQANQSPNVVLQLLQA